MKESVEERTDRRKAWALSESDSESDLKLI